MLNLACVTCGKRFEAKTKRSRYCSDRCRQRHHRYQEAAEPMPEPTPDLVAAVKRDLEAAGRLDTPAGMQALELARRFLTESSGNAVAALSRELRVAMVEAMAGAQVNADPVDEVRRRRESKAGQAAS